MKFVLPSLIKAGVPTANGNIYPQEVLEKLAEQGNARAADQMIPLRQPIDDASMDALKGYATKFVIDDEGQMDVEVEIADTHLASLVGVMEDAVVNTMVSVGDEDYDLVEKDVREIHRAELLAVSILPKKDAFKA